MKIHEQTCLVRNVLGYTPEIPRPALRVEVFKKDRQALKTLLRGGIEQVGVTLRVRSLAAAGRRHGRPADRGRAALDAAVDSHARVFLLSHDLKPRRCVGSLDEAHIARLEDVLGTYERPYDPHEPVVCIDEKPVTCTPTCGRMRVPAQARKSARQRV